MPGLFPLFPADMSRLALARQTVRRQSATSEELGEAVEVLATSSDPGDQMIARRLRNEAWATKGSEIVEADNFRLIGDAARVARLCCDMGQIAGDAEARSASRALGWWVVALLIVASVAVGMVVGHFAVKALANAAVAVVQAEQFQGEW
jgi:hypothetical protein